MCLRILTTHKYLMQNNSIKTAASHSGFWFRVNSYMLPHIIAPVQFPGQILAGTASVAEFLFIAGGTGARLTGFTVITCFTVERKRAFGCIAHKYHPPYTLLPTPPITASENNTGNSRFRAKNPISNIPVMYQAYEQQFLYFHYTLTKGEYK